MIRRTPQREAIFKAFQESRRPLSPSEAHQLGKIMTPGLGLRTVYRNIQEMVTEGRLVGVDYPGQPLKYELVSDKEDRPHFICRNCNQLFDLPGDLPEVQFSPPPGFTLEGHEIVFFGRCPKCICDTSEPANNQISQLK